MLRPRGDAVNRTLVGASPRRAAPRLEPRNPVRIIIRHAQLARAISNDLAVIMHLKHTLKFLHTIGSVGMMGSMAALLVIHMVLPPASVDPAYLHLRIAMGAIGNWVFLPSLAITLVAGLLAIAANRIFHDVGWVWVKLAFGILVFEAGLIAIHGPVRREAELAAALLTGAGDAAPGASRLGATLGQVWGALWLMMAIAVANIALGVWRPRFRRRTISSDT